MVNLGELNEKIKVYNCIDFFLKPWFNSNLTIEFQRGYLCLKLNPMKVSMN